MECITGNGMQHGTGLELPRATASSSDRSLDLAIGIQNEDISPISKHKECGILIAWVRLNFHHIVEVHEFKSVAWDGNLDEHGASVVCVAMTIPQAT
jgi:hypothetical protein